MAIFACKLPHGIVIDHNGKKITLRGGNIGEDLENVSRNGRPNDNANRVCGYGLTEVPDDAVEAFTDWANKVTYKDGKRASGKLAEPFAALENGSILGPFKTYDEARKEVVGVASAVTTGFEGLDAEAEAAKGGVEKNKDTEVK